MPQCENCGHDPERMDADLPTTVLKYLNQIAGKNYRFTKANLNPIIARAKSGAKFAEFKYVIENKWRHWKGTESEMYMRPETLFHSVKFEGYRNEPRHPDKEEDRISRAALKDPSSPEYWNEARRHRK